MTPPPLPRFSAAPAVRVTNCGDGPTPPPNSTFTFPARRPVAGGAPGHLVRGPTIGARPPGPVHVGGGRGRASRPRGWRLSLMGYRPEAQRATMPGTRPGRGEIPRKPGCQPSTQEREASEWTSLTGSGRCLEVLASGCRTLGRRKPPRMLL